MWVGVGVMHGSVEIDIIVFNSKHPSDLRVQDPEHRNVRGRRMKRKSSITAIR